MLVAESALRGFAIEASDGRIGTVSDFLFDDESWKIRWLVVDTGKWLTGRKVLVHPSAIWQADHENGELRVKLTKARVEASPDLLTDQPVSQQMEASLYDYYQWDPYWGSSYFPLGAMATPLSAPPYYGVTLGSDAGRPRSLPESGDPHLRSIAAVAKYHIHASDGEVGHVENFLVDDASWDIRYIIVATGNWWPGQHVLISPYSVREIIWLSRQVQLDVTRDQVKTSPPWDPIAMIDQVYEKQLHLHYRWPGYGWF